ncbi:MAG: copper chaperone PCu(A)C [Steroidobacteraceae bacterium]
MPTRPVRAFLFLAALTAGAMLSVASAAQAAPPAVEVQAENAWIPQPPPGAQVAAAYLTLRNNGRMAAVLVGVNSPVASNAMVHRTMVMNGESMMMPIERLTVPPGQTVTLKPDAMHVMLDGLHGPPLQVGQRVPLVLHFAGGAEIRVSALVRPLGSQ